MNESTESKEERRRDGEVARCLEFIAVGVCLEVEATLVGASAELGDAFVAVVVLGARGGSAREGDVPRGRDGGILGSGVIALVTRRDLLGGVPWSFCPVVGRGEWVSPGNIRSAGRKGDA